jgi:hypothetical protein
MRRPVPLDEIPPIAILTPGLRMPLSHHPLFVDHGELQKADQMLEGGRDGDHRPSADRAATTGLGGIGKVRLSAKFVYRYGQYFASGAFWLSFADPAIIPARWSLAGVPG